MKVNIIHLDQRGFLALTRWTKRDICWCPYGSSNCARRCNVQCPHFGRFDTNPEHDCKEYPFLLKLSCGNGAFIKAAEIENEYDGEEEQTDASEND